MLNVVCTHVCVHVCDVLCVCVYVLCVCVYVYVCHCSCYNGGLLLVKCSLCVTFQALRVLVIRNLQRVNALPPVYTAPAQSQLVSRARPFTDSCSPGRKGLVTRAHTFGAPGML